MHVRIGRVQGLDLLGDAHRDIGVAGAGRRETAKATTGSPLNRAKVRGSSAVSAKVASSSSRTLRLPGTTMDVAASVSRLADAASARIDCSCPPTSARPPACRRR